MEGEKKYKLIIFDLDGTLVNSVPLAHKAFLKLLTEQGITPKKFDLSPFSGSPTVRILRFMKNEYGLKGSLNDLRNERRRHFFEMIKDKNLLFSGVENTLKKLKKKYIIAIATGSSSRTMSKILPKKIMALFDMVVTIDDVKKGKPDPEQLLLISKKLLISPQECLMIGDSRFDQIAARKAKMDSIGVLSGVVSKKELLKAGAKIVINSVNELNKVI